jgi:arylsulfatase A-like enzyme
MKIKILLPVLFILLFSLAAIFLRQSRKVNIPERYNVILLIVDDLRPDHLGCYGYSRNTSPNIDDLASSSFIFENFFSDAAYTLPSTMSILTSLYPVSHGVLDVYKDKLSPRACTLAEVFENYGYKTAWFSVLNEPHLDINIGFGRGFQKTVDLDPLLNDSVDILSWIEEHSGEKFFLAVDTRSVHDYYDFFIKDETEKNPDLSLDVSRVNQQYYFKLVEAAKLKKPPFCDPDLLQRNKGLFNGPYREGKEKKILDLLDAGGKTDAAIIGEPLYRDFVKIAGPKYPRLLIDAYDRAIKYTDEELIKPVLEKIRELELCGKTIIIVTADHGELLGEHGFYGHNNLLVDESLRVPLIIKLPYSGKSRRIAALAQGVDIMPTVLELCGIPVPHQAQGKSLTGLMRKIGARPVREYVISEGESGRTIRSSTWRLLPDYSGHYLLYNLMSDPGEEYDLYPEKKDIVLRLESVLKAWEESLPSYRDREYFFDPGIDKETQEKIRKTGYW